MTKESGLRRLTLSESRVARLVAEGLSDEQVAERLGIGVMDVSAELAEVFRKLGLRSRGSHFGEVRDSCQRDDASRMPCAIDFSTLHARSRLPSRLHAYPA